MREKKLVRCALGQAWLDQDKNLLSCSKTRPGKQTPQSLSVGLMKEVKLDLCPRKHSGKWKLFWLSLIRDSCWREKEKLFSRNLSKKYPEKILGADGEFQKYPGKDLKGGRTVPKISWKGFEGRTVARLIGISKSKGWREERESHRGERQFSSIPWIPHLWSSQPQLSKRC